jgi:hypothetical protein
MSGYPNAVQACVQEFLVEQSLTRFDLSDLVTDFLKSTNEYDWTPVQWKQRLFVRKKPGSYLSFIGEVSRGKLRKLRLDGWQTADVRYAVLYRVIREFGTQCPTLPRSESEFLKMVEQSQNGLCGVSSDGDMLLPLEVEEPIRRIAIGAAQCVAFGDSENEVRTSLAVLKTLAEERLAQLAREEQK